MFHSYLELFINHNQWMFGRRSHWKTVNHGLHNVAKKFGIQKFTVEISIHRCKKPGRRNRSFEMVECSDVRMVSVTIFVPFPSKQQTKHVMTLSVCKLECPNFNTWGYGLRSKRFEGSRLYSKIILGL